MISVFDPTICSYNIGNNIIMDAVSHVLDDLFPMSHIVHIPCTDISTKARYYNRASDFSFLGGTNILSNDIRNNRNWDLGIHNLIILKNILLIGCGWFRYENNHIPKITKWGLNRILSNRYLHSVRDSYTQKKLAELGIDALNTGCPTLWGLNRDVIQKISVRPKTKVIVTITDYNRNLDRDIHLLNCCRDIYSDEIYFFPQGVGDLSYLQQLGYLEKVHIIPPRLSELDKLFSKGDIDYIGTRLHAGIRALQHSIRSFIIGVDNRALEMNYDFNIPVLREESIDFWSETICSDYSLLLNIPFEVISKWKGQFQ